MAETLKSRIFNLGPQNFTKKFQKRVKILNFFIIRARTFKFSGNVDFGALITYMLKNFGFGGSDVFLDAPKSGKTVKIYLLPQFLSQSLDIWGMCSPNHGQELQEPEF